MYTLNRGKRYYSNIYICFEGLNRLNSVAKFNIRFDKTILLKNGGKTNERTNGRVLIRILLWKGAKKWKKIYAYENWYNGKIVEMTSSNICVENIKNFLLFVGGFSGGESNSKDDDIVEKKS